MALSIRFRRGLLIAALALLVLAGLRLAVGPVVRVVVTREDPTTGRAVPFADQDVEIWAQHGQIRTRTNRQGRATFWRIAARSRWFPSLGPDNALPAPHFQIRVQPRFDGRSCPSFGAPGRFSVWGWQQLRVAIPAPATLRFDAGEDGLPPGRRRHLAFDYEPRERRHAVAAQINLDAASAWCVWPDQTVTATLEVDGEPYASWPSFRPEARGETVLRLQAATRHAPE